VIQETRQIKDLRRYVRLSMLLAAFGFLLSIAKNVVNEKWAKGRDTVACVPADVQSAFPMVYRQTALNPVQNDAMMKTFVQEYIEMTQNESIIDYHAQTVSGNRYNDFYLKENLKKAIELSLGNEKALNQVKLVNSTDTYIRLKKEEAGWIFLIDDILLFNGPQSNGGSESKESIAKGYTYAVVRGQFQITYDQVKNPASPKLWGYKEIHLLIKQGLPTYDTQNNPINKYGLFVEWSASYDLEPNVKEEYDRRSFDYYLRKNQ